MGTVALPSWAGGVEPKRRMSAVEPECSLRASAIHCRRDRTPCRRRSPNPGRFETLSGLPLDGAAGLRPLALHRERGHARGCERIVAGWLAPPPLYQPWI